MLSCMDDARLRRMLSKRLREARIRVYGGISQEAFANIVRVQQSQISRWESGESIPRLSELIRFAERCQTTPEELLRDLARPMASQVPLGLEFVEPQARPVIVKLIDLLRDKERGRTGRRSSAR